MEDILLHLLRYLVNHLFERALELCKRHIRCEQIVSHSQRVSDLQVGLVLLPILSRYFYKIDIVLPERKLLLQDRRELRFQVG